MARKLNVPRPPPRHNGADLQVTNRRPPPSPSTLYLMQLRAQSLKISPDGRPVRLAIEAEADGETPESVKINQTDSED